MKQTILKGSAQWLFLQSFTHLYQFNL